jgi:sulfatase maturation enzyme AslB (radical SAM superfamily)
MVHSNVSSAEFDAANGISFLWLELTNQCNLQCSHCYAESSPHTGGGDKLTRAKYEELIVDAYQTGCRRIQFIGGEPTLNRDLPALIRLAAATGYAFIEVFTNLTRLSDELVHCFKQYDVHLATSVYAVSAGTHDSITHVAGSFDRTIANIQRLLQAGIPVRAGVIEMRENAGQTEMTVRFLREMGVQIVGIDRLRHFGRGSNEGETALSELCGGCAENTLCVGSDGSVSPCIMSKLWSVGSVLDTPLAELAGSERLSQVRSEIYRAVVEPRKTHDTDQPEMYAICDPKTCGPYSSCAPKFGPGPCAPSGCSPCFPKG